jgi:hypothetical protein
MLRSLLAFLAIAALSGLQAQASGVERGMMPTEVSASSGVPLDVQNAAGTAIRARCQLDGVERVHAQTFTVELNNDGSGDKQQSVYTIDYMAYLVDTLEVHSIVLTATRSSLNGSVTVTKISSDLCPAGH